MKAYTDIEQSKKLAEILPIESADMAWEKHTNAEPHVTVKPWTTKGESIGAHVLPCWSLAALLDILTEQDFKIKAFDVPIRDCKIWYTSLLDAAFETICWLKKNNKL